MQWTAKHFDNVYLLTDEHPNLTNDLVVYVSPEDKTVVIDHQALNYEVIGKRTKVLWCYEPGKKLAGKTTFVAMPMATQVAAQTIAQELSKQIDNNLFMEVTFNNLLEQAKEMEKERIENSYNAGYNNGVLDTCLTSKQYYDKTFKQQEQ